MMKAFLSTQKNQSENKEGLLYQFLISTYLAAKEELNRLRLLLEAPPWHSTENSETDPNFKKISNLVTQLAGSSCECQPFSFSTLDTGSIAKLKNCCLLILCSLPKSTQSGKQLKSCANDLWFESRELLSMSSRLQMAKAQQNLHGLNEVEQLQDLMAIIAKINYSMAILGDAILALAKNFHDDENVAFFLLCQRQQLDLAYGQPITAKFILGSHESLAGKAAMLKKKYSERGFDMLVPRISEKIAELELSL